MIRARIQQDNAYIRVRVSRLPMGKSRNKGNWRGARVVAAGITIVAPTRKWGPVVQTKALRWLLRMANPKAEGLGVSDQSQYRGEGDRGVVDLWWRTDRQDWGWMRQGIDLLCPKDVNWTFWNEGRKRWQGGGERGVGVNVLALVHMMARGVHGTSVATWSRTSVEKRWRGEVKKENQTVEPDSAEQVSQGRSLARCVRVKCKRTRESTCICPTTNYKALTTVKAKYIVYIRIPPFLIQILHSNSQFPRFVRLPHQ